MNTNDLRKASTAVFLATEEAVATDLSNALKWAANEIDRLRKQSPHNKVLHRDTKPPCDHDWRAKHGCPPTFKCKKCQALCR